MGEVYSHLSEEERQVIQIEVGNGASIRGIGAMLGRSPSSISREIKRNTWFPSNENESYRPYRPKRLKAGPWTGRYYIAGPAQRKADRRRSKPRKPYRLSHDRLWAQVAEWLGRGWSPLLISGRLRVLWPDDALMRVCPETIYRWVYSSRPLRERWARCLPRGHRRRRRHGGRRTSRFPIPGRVPISERPPEADGRSAFGHWEADSVIGVGCNLHTEVERRTRFLMARIVPDKTAGESVGAQLDMFSPLPAGARVSVTHDNGTCLCSISCCGFSHDDFSGLGRACRPRNGLNWMVLVSPPERTGKDYDQHAPSTVYPSFAAERGIRRVDRAENTCQRADGA